MNESVHLRGERRPQEIFQGVLLNRPVSTKQEVANETVSTLWDTL